MQGFILMLVQNNRYGVLKIFDPLENKGDIDLFLDLLFAADELVYDLP